MSIRQNILQSRIDELQTRRERLAQKLSLMTEQRDHETRNEEIMRMDSMIKKAETDLRQVEADLIKYQDELNALLAAGASAPSPAPPPKPTTGPIKVFYSYAHKDEALRERLETHLALLRNQGVISDWHDRGISPGTEWEGQISQYLEEAHIILLLVSPDFMASKYIWEKELKRAMARHEAREARVIPIILREVDWKSAPFGKLQGLPRDAKPVTRWTDQDAAFTDIALGIRRVAEELAGKR